MSVDYVFKLRENFPIFNKVVNGKKLVYLDNAAITQVPISVINSFLYYYSNINSNVHRGVYFLSDVATGLYEGARKKIKKYINANNVCECIFVKGTTEAINLVAHSYLKCFLNKGDEILLSQMEHHSNIVPWYLLANSVGAKLKIIPMLFSGDLDLDCFNDLISDKTKIIAVTHISNSIGTINNIKKIISISHDKNVPVLIDGAQALGNFKIDVQDLDCDFYTISSHKMYGPSGVGILYAKKKYLDFMVPYQGGGDMIKHVEFSNIIWNDAPYKFEAGTPSIANIVAFGSCLDFLNSLNFNLLSDYKKKLFFYAIDKISSIKGVNIIANPKNRIEIISFVIENVHSHDFGTVADNYGISVRTGHHCSIPLMNYYNLLSTIRISLSFYNLRSDVDRLVEAILFAKKLLS